MSADKSRREFLRVATAASGASLLLARQSQATGPDQKSTIADKDNPGTTEQGSELLIVRDVPDQHYELLKLRTAESQASLQRSLTRPEARPVVVAAWQFRNHCGGIVGKKANLARMQRAIESAAQQRVQILAFPEMCLPGYFTGVSGTPEMAAQVNRELADQVGASEFLAELSAAAKTYHMVIAFGFCERAADKYYDAIGIIDADGTWLGVRRKNPLSPGPYDLESFSEPDPIQRTAVFTTRYAVVGIANCFDGEFPESVRRMRLAGAEILLWCNAGTGSVRLGSSNRLHPGGSYAQANLMWVVCCNAVSEDCYGTSLILGPSGDPLVMLPTDREALGVTTINLALSADWDRYRHRLDPVWKQ